jgi:TetR/AcrR family transcriptional regulator, cholesterol catabolism regulator
MTADGQPPTPPPSAGARRRRSPTANSAGVQQSTSDRVLETAARLFRRNGYAQTTTREIARVVGIEKGSLYYHIHAKEDLLYNLSVDSLTHISAAAERALAKAGDSDRLEAIVQAHVLSILEERDMHATMLIELRGLAPARQRRVVKLRDKYEALLRSVVEESQAAGRLRTDIDSKMLTLGLLNLLNWTIFWFRPGGEYSSQQVADALTSLFLQGAQASVRAERSRPQTKERRATSTSGADGQSSNGAVPTRVRPKIVRGRGATDSGDGRSEVM